MANVKQSSSPTTGQQMSQLCYDAYGGVGGFLDKSYLDKFSREESGYPERQHYSEYENKIAPITDSLVTPVFANPIVRENTNDLQDAFIKNCTNNGISLDAFMQDVGTYHKLIGNVFVVIDNSVGNPEDVDEAIAERAFPYVYYKLPQNISTYTVDVHGSLTSIDFYYNTIKDSKGKTKSVYRHIDALWQYDYYISNKKQELVGERVESATDGLPVIMSGTSIMPVPTMYSLCAMSRTLFNKQSVALQSEKTTAFNILQLPMDKPAPSDGDIKISNILYIPPEALRDAKFISPSVDIFKELWASANLTSESIDSVAKSYGAVPMINDKQTSGVAYAYEFLGNTFALTELAQVMETVEEEIFTKFNEFFTWSNDVVVTYDTNYTPGKTQLVGQYELYKDAVDLDISTTATKIYNIALVNTINALTGLDMSDEELQDISTELGEVTPEPTV
jgi:hypothetical protein